MRTTIPMLVLVTLAACGPKTTKTETAKTDDPTPARWSCITYEDAPSDCAEGPCPENDAYNCAPSDVAWCFGAEDENQGCALTHDECDARAVMALVDETETAAECAEMK